uniref:Histone domain-containing protein n=1 Tax=Steinernema glaseri TaxID=37863 RepID=A0A1I8AL89_9BILA
MPRIPSRVFGTSHKIPAMRVFVIWRSRQPQKISKIAGDVKSKEKKAGGKKRKANKTPSNAICIHRVLLEQFLFRFIRTCTSPAPRRSSKHAVSEGAKAIYRFVGPKAAEYVANPLIIQQPSLGPHFVNKTALQQRSIHSPRRDTHACAANALFERAQTVAPDVTLSKPSFGTVARVGHGSLMLSRRKRPLRRQNVEMQNWGNCGVGVCSVPVLRTAAHALVLGTADVCCPSPIALFLPLFASRSLLPLASLVP